MPPYNDDNDDDDDDDEDECPCYLANTAYQKLLLQLSAVLTHKPG